MEEGKDGYQYKGQMGTQRLGSAVDICLHFSKAFGNVAHMVLMDKLVGCMLNDTILLCATSTREVHYYK